MYLVKTKHIRKRRDMVELFVSPEQLEKCTYDVLTRHYRNVEWFYTNIVSNAAAIFSSELLLSSQVCFSNIFFC